MAAIVVTLEHDPVPIVCIIGNYLRQQLRHAVPASAAAKIHGKVALQSTVDPQAVTLNFSGKKIALTRGVSPDAKLTIQLDFNRMSDPSMKPVVKGLFRHPMTALQVDRLMAATPAPDWTESARLYWSLIADQPGVPAAIAFSSTDQNKSVIVGKGDPEIDIEGTSDNLSNFLTGNAVLVQAVMTKQLFMRGSFEHLSILSGISVDMLLGELAHD